VVLFGLLELLVLFGLLELFVLFGMLFLLVSLISGIFILSIFLVGKMEKVVLIELEFGICLFVVSFKARLGIKTVVLGIIDKIVLTILVLILFLLILFLELMVFIFFLG